MTCFNHVMFERILSIVFPVFAVVLAGWFYGRKHPVDMAVANQLSTDVFVPALVFAALADKSFDLAAHQALAWGAGIMVLASGALGWLLARFLHLPGKTLAPPMMFNNCGNLGLPLTLLAFGEPALAAAIVMFLVSNLMHFSLGNWMLDRSVRWWNVWRIPVVLATLAGLLVSVLQVPVWPPLKFAIKMLGDVSIPLLLFALGVRIAGSTPGALKLGLIGGLARPAIGIAVMLLYCVLFNIEGQARAQLILFGALPPAVLNFVFAERYQQQPEIVASIVLIGNVLAVLILPVVLAYIL